MVGVWDGLNLDRSKLSWELFGLIQTFFYLFPNSLQTGGVVQFLRFEIKRCKQKLNCLGISCEFFLCLCCLQEVNVSEPPPHYLKHLMQTRQCNVSEETLRKREEMGSFYHRYWEREAQAKAYLFGHFVRKRGDRKIRSRARITFRLSQAHSKNRTQLCSVFLIQMLQPTQNECKMQTLPFLLRKN